MKIIFAVSFLLLSGFVLFELYQRKMPRWFIVTLGMVYAGMLGLILDGCATMAHAEPVTVSRTLTWQQWRNIMAKCHVRAAGPITFPTPQPLVGTVISIFFSGEPEQIRCADQQLGATPTVGQ